jgi:hypothetical protein
MRKSDTMNTAAQAIQKSDEALDLLERSLKIDKYSLDDEFINHPDYMNKVGQNHAEAISYRDEAKVNVEGTYAKLDQEMRAEAVANNERITEDKLKARIITSAEYQNVLYLHGAWNDRVNRWRSLWESVCAKTDMLKELGRLYASGYWADQSISADRREVVSAVAEPVKKAIAEKARERIKAAG